MVNIKDIVLRFSKIEEMWIVNQYLTAKMLFYLKYGSYTVNAMEAPRAVSCRHSVLTHKDTNWKTFLKNFKKCTQSSPAGRHDTLETNEQCG